MNSFFVQTPTGSLDPAQLELRRLQSRYDDAVTRENAANAAAGKLQSALTSTRTPVDVTRLTTEVSTARRQAQEAHTEAERYARRAQAVLAQLRP